MFICLFWIVLSIADIQLNILILFHLLINSLSLSIGLEVVSYKGRDFISFLAIYKVHFLIKPIALQNFKSWTLLMLITKLLNFSPLRPQTFNTTTNSAKFVKSTLLSPLLNSGKCYLISDYCFVTSTIYQ